MPFLSDVTTKATEFLREARVHLLCRSAVVGAEFA